MSYLDKYTILESFHKNTIQNLQMGYIKSDPNHIVVINLINQSDLIQIEDFRRFVTAFTSVIEHEITDSQCILITDYHEGVPVEKFIDNFHPPLAIRLKLAHQFFALLSHYVNLPLYLLDKLIDAKHIIVKDNALTHNELLMYDVSYNKPDDFSSISINLGRLLTLLVPDVNDRHAQSFYTIIDDLLHGKRFDSLEALLLAYNQIAGRYKKDLEPQVTAQATSKDVWEAFDLPLATLAAGAVTAAVVAKSHAESTPAAGTVEENLMAPPTDDLSTPALESSGEIEDDLTAGTDPEPEHDLNQTPAETSPSDIQTEPLPPVVEDIPSDSSPIAPALDASDLLEDRKHDDDLDASPDLLAENSDDSDRDVSIESKSDSDFVPKPHSEAENSEVENPSMTPLLFIPELEPLASREIEASSDSEFNASDEFEDIPDTWKSETTPVNPILESDDLNATDAVMAEIIAASETPEVIVPVETPNEPLSDVQAIEDDPFKAIHLQIDDRIKLEENRKKKMWLVLLPILLLLLVIIGIVVFKPFSFKSYQAPVAQFTQTKTDNTWLFTSTSSSDPNLSLKTHQWTLSKEGITLQTKTEKDFSYTFTEIGTYEISLKVMDSKLKWSKPFTLSLVIDATNLPGATEATEEVTTEAATGTGEVLPAGIEEDSTKAKTGAFSYKVTLGDIASPAPELTMTKMNFEGKGVLAVWINTADKGKISLEVIGLSNNTEQFKTTIESDNYPLNQWFLLTQNIETTSIDTLRVAIGGTVKTLWLDDITIETIK